VCKDNIYKRYDRIRIRNRRARAITGIKTTADTPTAAGTPPIDERPTTVRTSGREGLEQEQRCQQQQRC
jgi:hypothetical protein